MKVHSHVSTLRNEIQQCTHISEVGTLTCGVIHLDVHGFLGVFSDVVFVEEPPDRGGRVRVTRPTRQVRHTVPSVLVQTSVTWAI